jgi:heme/copper-type cytochrome/quinol oxidase subunit 4
MNYKDRSLPPSHYFVKKGHYGKIYRVNKPKNNFIVVNRDPSLGGTKFTSPVGIGLASNGNCGLFGSNFDNSCSKTPRSTYYQRIVPWDDEKSEFVYAVIQECVFRGFFDRRSLRARIRQEIGHEKSKSTFFKWSQIFILSFLVIAFFTALIFMTVSYRVLFKQPLLYIIPCLAILGLVLAMFLVTKQGENSRNKKRFQQINKACEDINSKHLFGTGTQVHPGPDGAWLEIDLDPRRTIVEGEALRDSSEIIADNYISGHDRHDEGVKQVYAKRVVRPQLHELDRSLEVSEVVFDQERPRSVIRAKKPRRMIRRILDHSHEVKNSPKKSKKIDSITKRQNSLSKLEAFRKELHDSIRKQKRRQSQQQDIESSKTSAQFGFVHTQSNQLGTGSHKGSISSLTNSGTNINGILKNSLPRFNLDNVQDNENPETNFTGSEI